MKNKLLILSFLIVSICTSIYPQDLSGSDKLYDDSEMAIIKVKMDVARYLYMMQHPEESIAYPCTVHFKNAFIDDSVENVGIRIRGNTSRKSDKKSFKLSFDEFEQGREFYDVDKLNLNGEHNDPSMSRAKFCWDIFQQVGITASRAAHAAFYINGLFHGVYISIENIDNEFLKKNYADPSGNLWKCLYPADLTYKGDQPALYYYQKSFPAYELETNTDKKDYSQLVRLIKIINQTAQVNFADSLESILFVDEFIKYHALNVLLGSWDDYWSVMNNYYLYLDPVKHKFHWLPYDYDNSFGIDFKGINWSGSNPYNYPQHHPGSRPLLTNILKVPEYRNLYTHFLDFYKNNIVNLQNLEPNIDRIKNIVAEYADDDNYRTLDYGFSYSDFLNSFSNGVKEPSKMGIKNFISTRSGNIGGMLNYVAANPIVYNIEHEVKNDSVYVYASGYDNEGLASMIVQYSAGSVSGNASMVYSPIYNSHVEDSDRWVGVFPLIKNDETINYKIEITDKSQHKILFPRSEYANIKPVPSSLGSSVVINEILADNGGLTPDPAGDNDDWIELYNPTNQAVVLTGMYLTDSRSNPTKWQFTQTGLILNPGQFLVVWCDEDSSQDGLHAGFKLSKDGEFVGLIASDSTTWLDSLTFGIQSEDISFARLPDGGSSWSFGEPTPGSANIISAVKEDKEIPGSFYISAYPNPFNPSTNIEYNLPAISDVSISIYDILGREVWSFAEQDKQSGKHTFKWNAENNSGIKLSTGIYLCRIEAMEYASVIKLVLMK